MSSCWVFWLIILAFQKQFESQNTTILPCFISRKIGHAPTPMSFTLPFSVLALGLSCLPCWDFAPFPQGRSFCSYLRVTPT